MFVYVVLITEYEISLHNAHRFEVTVQTADDNCVSLCSTTVIAAATVAGWSLCHHANVHLICTYGFLFHR